MTMVVNTLKEFAGVQHEHAVYIKDANALLRIYRESVAVVDLTNAMQAGKTCKKYSFIFANADNGISGLVNFLDDLAFADFVNYCRAGNYAENSERLEIIGVKYHESELKACRVASPFAKVKKQTFTGKVTAVKIAKAILAGQIIEITCTGRYTDDYYDDAKRNICKGKTVTDLLKFAGELLEDKSCFGAELTADPKVISLGWGTFASYEAVIA